MTDSWTSNKGIRGAQRSRPSSPASERRFYRNSGQNKRVTELGASPTTPAAFQSGQHNRWLAAATCGVTPAQVRQDVRDFQLFQTVLRGRKTPWQCQRVLLAFFRPSPGMSGIGPASFLRELSQYTRSRLPIQLRFCLSPPFRIRPAGSAGQSCPLAHRTGDGSRCGHFSGFPHLTGPFDRELPRRSPVAISSAVSRTLSLRGLSAWSLFGPVSV